MSKKHISIFILPLLGLLLGVTACKKEDPELDIDPIPYITLEEVSATQIQEFQEDITITIGYEDEDGDLGFENPDSLSVEVKDSRLSLPDLYHLQPLAPPDTELHIVGTINVVVPSPFLLGNGTSETVNYTVRIRDRAGNWSNPVTTEDIIITE